MSSRSRPLIDSEDIILPVLHIKLGLVSNFIKALVKRVVKTSVEADKDPENHDTVDDPIRFLKMIFPRKTYDKICAGKNLIICIVIIKYE